MSGLREDPFRLYLDSHKIYSKQVIKNTFYKALKQYYKVSNRINITFYTSIAFLAFIYIFFHL